MFPIFKYPVNIDTQNLILPQTYRSAWYELWVPQYTTLRIISKEPHSCRIRFFQQQFTRPSDTKDEQQDFAFTDTACRHLLFAHGALAPDGSDITYHTRRYIATENKVACAQDVLATVAFFKRVFCISNRTNTERRKDNY